jgi:hypothetical protein
LGEWAWKNFRNEINSEKYVGMAWGVYWKITLACLGREEVERRLKERKKE